MWYSTAYNKVASGVGGGILPPLPYTNNKIATPPEEKQMLDEIDERSQQPKPQELKTIQEKLRDLHTNGFFPIPPTSMRGINAPAAIEDQYQPTGPAGQGYELQGV